jgi:putative intracellular protease/amidase
VQKRNLLIILPSKNFNEDEYNILRAYFNKSGVGIFISSVQNGICVGEKGLKVQSDVLLCNINQKNFAGVIFIGGSGVMNDLNNSDLHDLAVQFNTSKKLVAAICAAPLILGNAGLLKGAEATCYNKYKIDLEKLGAKYVDIPTVKSGNTLTSQSPESAREFASLVIDQITK